MIFSLDFTRFLTLDERTGRIKGIFSFPGKGNLAAVLAQVRAFTLRNSAGPSEHSRTILRDSSESSGVLMGP